MALYDTTLVALTVVCAVVNRATGFRDGSGNVVAKPGRDSYGYVLPIPEGETTAYVRPFVHPTTSTRAAIPADAIVLAAIAAAIADSGTDAGVRAVLQALPAPVASLDSSWVPS